MATPVLKESPKLAEQDSPPSSTEALIKYNGDLIESLLQHEGWRIVEDLIDEGVASVVGRKTNGLYYEGSLVRGDKNKDYLTGYQEALTQLYNRIKSFISIRDNRIASKKAEDLELNAPVYNPFMEESYES